MRTALKLLCYSQYQISEHSKLLDLMSKPIWIALTYYFNDLRFPVDSSRFISLRWTFAVISSTKSVEKAFLGSFSSLSFALILICLTALLIVLAMTSFISKIIMVKI